MISTKDRFGWALAGAATVAVSIALSGCGKSDPEPEATPPQGSLSQGQAPAQTTPPADAGVAATNDQASRTPQTTQADPAPTQTPPTAPAQPAPSGPYAAGLTWDAPSWWLVVPTDGVMRKAQYTLAPAAGSGLASGECAFFHFGAMGQGGDVQANLDRWGSQMLDAQGGPTAPIVSEFDLPDGLKVTTGVYQGTYLSGMPGGPTTPVENSMLLGAIVEGGPMGALFVRVTGPIEVVDMHREAWELMIRSIRLAEDPGK